MMSQASMFSLFLSLRRDRDRETVGLFLSDKIGSDQMRVCNLPGNNLHGDIERQTRQKWFTLSIKYFARTSYQNIFPSSIEIFSWKSKTIFYLWKLSCRCSWCCCCPAEEYADKEDLKLRWGPHSRSGCRTGLCNRKYFRQWSGIYFTSIETRYLEKIVQ